MSGEIETCERCSHLRSEHCGSGGECDCCRCERFIFEPDDAFALALSALGWVCAEGQRNCRYARSLAFTCCEELPYSPDEWCDVCVTGAAFYAIARGQLDLLESA